MSLIQDLSNGALGDGHEFVLLYPAVKIIMVMRCASLDRNLRVHPLEVTNGRLGTHGEVSREVQCGIKIAYR